MEQNLSNLSHPQLGEPVKDSRWRADAACAPRNRPKGAEDLDWYATNAEDKYEARAICQNACPVRKECLQEALANQELWGIHGGVDDYEIRRAMSVDANGDPTQRDRAPRCPYCMSKKLTISGQKIGRGYATTCTECELKWYMARIPTKLKGLRTAGAGQTREDIGA